MAVVIDGSAGITTRGITDSAALALTGTGAKVTDDFTNATAGNLMLVQGTAQASTSGTSITFTGIPSWVKRITVMFNGVSTTGTSNLQVQIGSGSVTTTGYVSGTSIGTTYTSATTGFLVYTLVSATDVIGGTVTLCLVSSNTWVESGVLNNGGASRVSGGNGPALSGALDRVVITTVNGTDTFDAGTINIQYE
jgi:hypothetical protein